MRGYGLFSQQMTKLNDIDHRILRELTRDARQSNLALADRVGLSPSACLRRVQALENAGVIKSYRAVLDPARLGIGFVAYVTVGLGTHTKAAQEAFERAVARAPEVRECHNITGTVEYLLRIECADLAAYKHWHTEGLGTLPQVRAITTYVVMGSPKDDRA
jgi:Lrp/AsnC family transcriptional regulator, leucine-responsive regulatory protein